MGGRATILDLWEIRERWKRPTLTAALIPAPSSYGLTARHFSPLSLNRQATAASKIRRAPTPCDAEVERVFGDSHAEGGDNFGLRFGRMRRALSDFFGSLVQYGQLAYGARPLGFPRYFHHGATASASQPLLKLPSKSVAQSALYGRGRSERKRGFACN